MSSESGSLGELAREAELQAKIADLEKKVRQLEHERDLLSRGDLTRVEIEMGKRCSAEAALDEMRKRATDAIVSGSILEQRMNDFRTKYLKCLERIEEVEKQRDQKQEELMTHVHADLLVTSQIHYATAAIAEVEGVLLPFGGTAAIRLDFLMRDRKSVV